MRIGIDVRCFADGRRTGVEEYALGFLDNIFQMDTRNEYVLFFNSFKKRKVDFSWTDKYPNVTIKKFNYPNKILNLFFWYLNWPKIDRMVGGADIFFMPNINFYSVSEKTKLILTVHDLSYERYAKTFSWKRRIWHFFVNPQKMCKKADAIISISHSTAQDIMDLFGIGKGKIRIIYNGISDKFKLLDRNNPDLIKAKERYNLPYKFILYLGTIEPRKNIVSVVRAYNKLQKNAIKEGNEEMQKIKLVIAGSEGWLGESIFDEIRKSKYAKNIIVAKFIKEEDKECVLNLASLFVYPSFFEGFGFPPLEAMACGTPTITSNNSSLPEVVGNGAIMIDPDKPDEIFCAMREVIKNNDFRNDLVSRGALQAKKFTWKKSAGEFLKMINKY
ncbi:MAG: hypothetical protein ACD_15C00190G0005 [uncultured bacterium]|nr:MAG: hypothetical protein ACD_15C00190G0005 [uncultured bacterium]HCU70845.1 glycosyltransferase family 1 protein [Candidatus Moranbacteria bacterium]